MFKFFDYLFYQLLVKDNNFFNYDFGIFHMCNIVITAFISGVFLIIMNSSGREREKGLKARKKERIMKGRKRREREKGKTVEEISLL